MMKRTFKRILAAALSAVMIAGMGLAVYAKNYEYRVNGEAQSPGLYNMDLSISANTDTPQKGTEIWITGIPQKPVSYLANDGTYRSSYLYVNIYGADDSGVLTFDEYIGDGHTQLTPNIAFTVPKDCTKIGISFETLYFYNGTLRWEGNAMRAGGSGEFQSLTEVAAAGLPVEVVDMPVDPVDDQAVITDTPPVEVEPVEVSDGLAEEVIFTPPTEENEGIMLIDESSVQPEPVVTAANNYTVVKGDNLSRLSQRFYGSQNCWTLIFDANRGVIKNPDQLQVGWNLVIPDAQISNNTQVVVAADPTMDYVEESVPVIAAGQKYVVDPVTNRVVPVEDDAVVEESLDGVSSATVQ